jgi:hypothetical protein
MFQEIILLHQSYTILIKHPKGLFVWAVCGWLFKESCCAEKAAVQGKLLFQVSPFGDLAGCLAV